MEGGGEVEGEGPRNTAPITGQNLLVVIGE